MKKWFAGIFTVAACLAVLGLPTNASAASITFNFNCQSDNSTSQFPPAGPAVCTSAGEFGAGPFGSLTLTDSVIDQNRVDIAWSMAPAFGGTIEQVLLNFSGAFLTNHDLYVVSKDAAAGSTTEITGVTSIYSNNAQSMGQFAFDFRVNEAAPNNDLVFSGSLALRKSINPFGFVNLSVLDFLVPTVPTVGNPGNPPLYAAYRTNNCVPATNCNGYSGEFWAGATSYNDTIPAPEPTSMLLLGTGIAGLVARRRRAGSKKS